MSSGTLPASRSTVTRTASPTPEIVEPAEEAWELNGLSFTATMMSPGVMPSALDHRIRPRRAGRARARFQRPAPTPSFSVTMQVDPRPPQSPKQGLLPARNTRHDAVPRYTTGTAKPIPAEQAEE